MTMRTVVALLAMVITACATTTPPSPPPTPEAGETLEFRWMRSSEPVANMRVALFRGAASRVGTTDANGRIAALDGGFDIGVVSSPNDTWGIDVANDPSGVVRVPEPIRIQGRVESATPNARIRLRVGYGKRRPTMVRHPFPAETDNKVIAGIELPPSASQWDEVTLDAGGAFTTTVMTSESDPQLVALDDAGGMTALEVPVPAKVANGATTLDAGTIRIAPPIALDLGLDLPETDMPVTLIAAITNATFDPAQRDAIARHLSVLDQFDDTIFEFASGRMPYALELEGTTLIAGLPPFATVDLDVAGPKPGLGMHRTVTLSHDGPTAVRITAADLNVRRLSDLPPVKGRIVLAGTETPVANATVVYSDYPVRQEARSDASGNFTIARSGPPRQPVWFIDARKSNVPDRYKATAVIPFEEGETELELPVKEQPQANVRNLFDACDDGRTENDQYPACRGWRKNIFDQWEPGDIFDCGTNESLNSLQFDVAKTVDETERWAIYYAYTPFLVFYTGEIEVPEQTWSVNMQLIGKPVNSIVLQFCSDATCTERVPSTPFQISSFLEDPDSYEGTAFQNGFFFVNCINLPGLNLYVNYESSQGVRFFYDARVGIDNQTGLVKLRSEPVLGQPWTLWRGDANPFRP